MNPGIPQLTDQIANAYSQWDLARPHREIAASK